MTNPQFPTARKTGLVVQEVTDEVLLYDLESNKAHCLNQTAALVWKSCNGNNSVSEIAKHLESQTGGKVSDDLIWLAIDQLSEKNLLETRIESRFAGQSRREVIKKIGMAAVIGLPIVASLVAPKSALANISCGCPSGTTGDCIGPGIMCPTTACSMSFLCV
ncbi:MAG: PqqD family protein [Blastocatellia bacterium]